MADRDGFLGNALANGLKEAAKEIGNGAEYYNMSVKNNPHPAHMPQGKKEPGAALLRQYLWQRPHERHAHAAIWRGRVPGRGRGLPRFVHDGDLRSGGAGPYRSRQCQVTYYSQLWRAVIDSICVCMMGFGPTGNMYGVKSTVSIVNAATGWDTNFWEMMKAGERTRNLMAMFNHREGLTIEGRYAARSACSEQPFTEGTLKGVTVDKEDLLSARELYYDMVGWNTKTGEPKLSKIYEMDLGWALERM